MPRRRPSHGPIRQGIIVLKWGQYSMTRERTTVISPKMVRPSTSLAHHIIETRHRDRDYFNAHPDQFAYAREYVEGEFWPWSFPTCKETVVWRVDDGKRCAVPRMHLPLGYIICYQSDSQHGDRIDGIERDLRAAECFLRDGDPDMLYYPGIFLLQDGEMPQ